MSRCKLSAAARCHVLPAALVAAATFGCQEPMQIRYAYGPGEGLREWGPYFTWLPEKFQPTTSYVTDHPELHAWIRQLIENGLIAKGYIKASPTTAPDIWVQYYVGRKRTGVAYGAGAYQEFEEGAMIIDFVNPKTDRLLWRGSAQARVNDTSDPAQRRKRIEEAVNRILEKFPSQKKTK
jgi:hypothetical protein